MEQSKGRALSKRGDTLSWIVTSEKLWYFLLILISIIAGYFLLTSPRPEIVPALAIVVIIGLTFLFFPYLGVLVYMILSYLRFEETVPALGNLHLTRLLAIALIVVWAIRAASTKSKLYLQEKGLILLYLFFLMLAFSIPFSFWPTKSFNTFVDMLKILVFTIIFIHLLDSQKKLKSFIWVFLIVNGFLAFNAIKDFILLGPTAVSTRIGGGGEGFLGDANDFALALNVALPFTSYLFLSEKKKVLKFIFLLFLILFTLGIISTASRGGFITLFIVFFYLILKSKKKLVGIFSIVLILISIFFFAPREYWERQMTITSYQQDESAMGRIHAWEAGAKMFADRPLSGVGVGAYEVAYGVKYGGKSGPWFAPHNTYIQISAETGIFGILFYLGLIFYIYKQSTLLIKNTREGSYLKSISFGLKGALLAYAVGSFFLSVGYYPHLYLLLGIAILVKILKEAEVT
jgi:probable O-glycosylation ligase (exosortase A-associated)